MNILPKLNRPDLICLSHLRWNFVFQRPQHLMSRFARARRVFFVEEPVFDSAQPHLQVAVCPHTNVHVVTPHLNADVNPTRILGDLLKNMIVENGIDKPVVWYYTPMAMEFFPRSVQTSAVVYDCMDELTMFRGAPQQLEILEKYLMRTADLVFTGGVSLFEAKRTLHTNVHPFPSGVDLHHFAQARNFKGEMADQESIPHARIGYAGVIDERIDLELVDQTAALRPDWQFIMIGPTAKISPESLPRRANIHWLGMKNYSDLPKYFAGWDVAMMPFAINDATRFISPTKTPEYLAAGLPVVSTRIRDVVRPYEQLGLVRIADTAEEFVRAAERSIAFDMSMKWRERADEYLKSCSWDSVFEGMNRLISGVSGAREKTKTAHQSMVATPEIAGV